MLSSMQEEEDHAEDAKGRGANGSRHSNQHEAMRPNVKTDTIVLCFLVYSLVPFSMEVLNLPTRIIWCG